MGRNGQLLDTIERKSEEYRRELGRRNMLIFGGLKMTRSYGHLNDAVRDRTVGGWAFAQECRHAVRKNYQDEQQDDGILTHTTYFIMKYTEYFIKLCRPTRIVRFQNLKCTN